MMGIFPVTLKDIFALTDPPTFALALKAQSEITDIEAELAVDLCGFSSEDKHFSRVIPGIGIEIKYPHTNIKDCITWRSLSFSAYKYLQMKGYELPVFIAENHPDNWKTPTQLEIAVYSQIVGNLEAKLPF